MPRDDTIEPDRDHERDVERRLQRLLADPTFREVITQVVQAFIAVADDEGRRDDGQRDDGQRDDERLPAEPEEEPTW